MDNRNIENESEKQDELENEIIATQTTNGKAIASLVLGILSIVSALPIPIIAPVFSILGLVFGIIALRDIKLSFQPGRGLAIAGIICSVVGLFLVVVIILIFFVFAMFLNVYEVILL